MKRHEIRRYVPLHNLLEVQVSKDLLFLTCIVIALTLREAEYLMAVVNHSERLNCLRCLCSIYNDCPILIFAMLDREIRARLRHLYHKKRYIFPPSSLWFKTVKKDSNSISMPSMKEYIKLAKEKNHLFIKTMEDEGTMLPEKLKKGKRKFIFIDDTPKDFPIKRLIFNSERQSHVTIKNFS